LLGLVLLDAVVLLPLGIVNATVTLKGCAVVTAGLTSQVWACLLPTHAVTVVPGSSTVNRP